MKKKFLIPVILFFALLIGGLWYTRPQNFWAATDIDRDKITGASGYAIQSYVTAGKPSQQTWFLDSLIPGQEDYEALMELLEGTSYRASLQNLLPPSSSHPADHITATASFALGDELVVIHADYPGKVWIASPAHSRTLVFSISPGNLNETLTDFIQQWGTAGNS